LKDTPASPMTTRARWPLATSGDDLGCGIRHTVVDAPSPLSPKHTNTRTWPVVRGAHTGVPRGRDQPEVLRLRRGGGAPSERRVPCGGAAPGTTAPASWVGPKPPNTYSAPAAATAAAESGATGAHSPPLPGDKYRGRGTEGCGLS